jgi:hypothetical protein
MQPGVALGRRRRDVTTSFLPLLVLDIVYSVDVGARGYPRREKAEADECFFWFWTKHIHLPLPSLSRVWVAAAQGYVCHPSASFSVRARGATRRRGGDPTELQILFAPSQFRFSERGR